MKVQFLGTGGFHPNERRHTAGVLLPELGIVFDAGTSAFRLLPHLANQNLQIFLSHAHLDHICGLTYLLLPLIDQPHRNCTIYAQPDVLQAVDDLLLRPPLFPVRPRLDLIPIPDQIRVAGGTMRWLPLEHPGGAVGFRLDMHSGTSLAYVSDTNAQPESIPFLQGVDVLIHECTYPDRLSHWCAPTGHSHTSQVARLARDAAVGQLLLTHIDPQLDSDDPLVLADARHIFAATQLAEDLLEFEF